MGKARSAPREILKVNHTGDALGSSKPGGVGGGHLADVSSRDRLHPEFHGAARLLAELAPCCPPGDTVGCADLEAEAPGDGTAPGR